MEQQYLLVLFLIGARQQAHNYMRLMRNLPSLREGVRVRTFDLCKKSILQAASKAILLIPDPDLHLILSIKVGNDAYAIAFFQRIIALTGRDSIDNIRNKKLLNDAQVGDFLNNQH
ncbi:hypothetical protein IQ277_09715 [Nostocales cyanobacterium LEGE 12452]|nr:hypothetical protein [Nostocales cyanobacterium LEGE 12452]